MIASSNNIGKNSGYPMKELKLSPENVAKYLLLKAAEEGDTITPLKIQKLVYLSYARSLINGFKLFDEPFQAWPNGPVIPSLYRAFKEFGYNPIDQSYYIESKDTIDSQLKEALPFIHEAFTDYAPRTAFDLVALTHLDGAWNKAREGLGITDSSQNVISDDLIFAAYSNR